jgi:hypothetical protein
MKVLITENKMSNLIKKYILSNYSMVADVYFTPDTIYLGGGPNHKGEKGLFTRTVIHIVYINGKMEYSPTYTTKKISREINDMFGLRLTNYGSYWDIKSEWLK